MARIEDLKVAQEGDLFRVTDGHMFSIASTDPDVIRALLEAQSAKNNEGIWRFTAPELKTAHEEQSQKLF